MPPVGPCSSWIVLADLTCDDGTDPQRQAAIDAATEVLWALSGRRYGECEATVRPCRPASIAALGDVGHGWRPALIDGQWWNVCGHRSSCFCGDVDELQLPHVPVLEVTSVDVDGVALVEGTDWRLDARSRLVRLDGERWPVCQDLTAAPGDPGAFTVTYTYGTPVPTLGKQATVELACELVKSAVGKPCRLPQRVTSLTRQGVSMTFLDPQDFLTEGRTGLYVCDLWLATVNPDRITTPPSVWSPDVPMARRA